MEGALESIWRRIIVGEGKGWVVFSNGTCVVFGDAAGNLAESAHSIMRERGPVHVGSSAGDFSVISLDHGPGWVVTCHHPDVLTYVSPQHLGPEPSDLEIGLLGRAKRQADADEFNVIHVEEGRRGS